MRRALLVVAGIVAGFVGFASWWRRHPRFGTRFVNETVDPWLVRRGIVDRSRGELAVLEHVGRRSGIVRFTPVHPERVPDGIRILVPLGASSEWVRNVMAAGHCRMQVGDEVQELDEPLLVEPGEVDDVPFPVRWLYGWLGFRYLRLHRFAHAPGSLGGSASEAPTEAEPAPSTEPSPEMTEVVAG